MKIEHIALWAKDIEAMKRFYETYFDAQANNKYTNPTKGFQSYFLTFTSGARMELMQKPGIGTHEKADPADEFLGYAHFAFALGSESAVNEKTHRLVSDGFIKLDGPRWTGDGYYESVILDPEGNRIEITV